MSEERFTKRENEILYLCECGQKWKGKQELDRHLFNTECEVKPLIRNRCTIVLPFVNIKLENVNHFNRQPARIKFRAGLKINREKCKGLIVDKKWRDVCQLNTIDDLTPLTLE